LVLRPGKELSTKKKKKKEKGKEYAKNEKSREGVIQPLLGALQKTLKKKRKKRGEQRRTERSPAGEARHAAKKLLQGGAQKKARVEGRPLSVKGKKESRKGGGKGKKGNAVEPSSKESCGKKKTLPLRGNLTKKKRDPRRACVGKKEKHVRREGAAALWEKHQPQKRNSDHRKACEKGCVSIKIGVRKKREKVRRNPVEKGRERLVFKGGPSRCGRRRPRH